MQNTSKYIYSSQVRLLCLHLCQFLLLCFCGNLQCMWHEFQSLAMQLAVGSQELASEFTHFTTTPTIPMRDESWVTISPQKGQGMKPVKHAMSISSVLRARQWRIATCHCRIQKMCVFDEHLQRSTVPWRVSSPMNSHEKCHAGIILHCYYNILQHSLYCSNSQK